MSRPQSIPHGRGALQPPLSKPIPVLRDGHVNRPRLLKDFKLAPPPPVAPPEAGKTARFGSVRQAAERAPGL
jgi:hypothetical protein